MCKCSFTSLNLEEDGADVEKFRTEFDQLFKFIDAVYILII